MRKTAILSCGVALCALSLGSGALGQTDAGALEIIARITPTGARPEPVRQFTFYILTKSYSEIVKEVEEKDPIPPRDRFIDDLKVSPELRAWKNLEVIDRKSTRLNSSHLVISYAVFCLKKKKIHTRHPLTRPNCAPT